MKRIVLTGGGTAGHVSPNQALLPHLIEKGYEVHYIGTRGGIEKQLMDTPPVHYHIIHSGKLRRYFDVQNFIDPFRIVRGFFEAAAALKKIRPAIVFSKGGFVAVPVVIAAAMLRIPVLCHESDLTPGLANRISSRFAQKVCTTFPECADRLGGKGIYTGTPLKPSLFEGSPETGLKMTGFTKDKPVLLMMGGSQGAKAVNEALRSALPDLLPHMQVVHLCGKGHLKPGLNGLPGYRQFEFVQAELPHLLAAADMVLSRAGANALCEFHALKKPMLLIPLPLSQSRGDQILNARSYEKRGLAMVLSQEEMTKERLTKDLMALLEKREAFAFENAPIADGTEKVLALIEEYQKKAD